MIAHSTDQRPPGDLPVDAPKLLMQTGISLANPRQIRRRRKYAEAAVVLQGKMRTKGMVELAWRVVAGPDRVIIHADRHHLASKAHLCPRPPPAPQVVREFPRAISADHGEYQPAARHQQPRAFARHVVEIRHTIEWAEIRISTIVGACFVQAVQFMRADVDGAHAIHNSLSGRAIAGPM